MPTCSAEEIRGNISHEWRSQHSNWKIAGGATDISLEQTSEASDSPIVSAACSTLATSLFAETLPNQTGSPHLSGAN